MSCFIVLCSINSLDSNECCTFATSSPPISVLLVLNSTMVNAGSKTIDEAIRGLGKLLEVAQIAAQETKKLQPGEIGDGIVRSQPRLTPL